MINIQAPINTLGYGVAGYNLTKQLYKLDQTTTLYPIGTPEFQDQDIQVCTNNMVRAMLDRPFVKIWHQHDLFQRIGRGKYFGFPIFELTEFSPLETVSLHHCDDIMVCSYWAKEVIVNNTNFGNHQTHVVPLGVDCDVFYPTRAATSPKTIFFNCGKWEKRKGHDLIVTAFNKAFAPQDNVELWMMCDNPFLNEDQVLHWIKTYGNSSLGEKIKFISRKQYHSDVARLMNMVDCGVFPARAEGWNLELLEMMACGKHVIATNYSAHTEFCTNENCLLIDIDNLETAVDNVFFDGTKGLWAELATDQEDQLIHHMRHIHTCKQNGELGINNAGIQTANRFGWHHSVSKLIEAVNE